MTLETETAPSAQDEWEPFAPKMLVLPANPMMITISRRHLAAKGWRMMISMSAGLVQRLNIQNRAMCDIYARPDRSGMQLRLVAEESPITRRMSRRKNAAWLQMAMPWIRDDLTRLEYAPFRLLPNDSGIEFELPEWARPPRVVVHHTGPSAPKLPDQTQLLRDMRQDALLTAHAQPGPLAEPAPAPKRPRAPKPDELRRAAKIGCGAVARPTERDMKEAIAALRRGDDVAAVAADFGQPIEVVNRWAEQAGQQAA